MAESNEPYNVVLEIGELDGTKNITNNVIIGYNDIDVYYGCTEPANSSGDMGFNPTNQFPDIYKEGYSGAYIGYYWGVGDTALGCSQTQIQPNLAGIAYEPSSNAKLIMFNLGVVGVSPPNFHRLEPWSWGNGLHRPYNGVQQARQGDWNVQGRCLYIKRTVGSVVTMCFDIVDSYGNDMLIVKGNGGDHLDDYAQIDNIWHVGNQAFSHEDYTWYVSPYVHSGKWDSSGNTLSWNAESQSKAMSYRGKMFSGSQQNLEINECFVNEGYLGLRGSDFREAIVGTNWDDNQPGINTGLQSWEIKITVASIVNAKIQLFEGTPENSAITSGLTNGFEILTPGVYTVCLAALPHSAVWKGKNNSGNFALADTGMERVAGSPLPEFADMMDGQLTLLNVEQIDSGSGASVIIESIELNKKDPDLRREQEPIYGSTLDYDVDNYKWNFLEVFESEGVPLSLNFSVGDISDISKRTAGYSKTFMLPASPHNNSVLTPMLGVNSEKRTIGWQRGRVKANGVHVFEGLMRIEEGNTANGGFYKCHIVEDTIDWTEELGESKLCDILMLGEDWNGQVSPTTSKNSELVQLSWLFNKPFPTRDETGVEIPAQPWFWGLAQYGEWYHKSINTANKQYTHNAQDFHPVVYTKVLVDKIFESIGYTVESRFFNSTTAHLLCQPFGAGESYLISNNIFGSGGDYYAKAKISGSHQADDLLGQSNFKNGGYVPESGHNRTWFPSILVHSDASNCLSGNGGTGTAYGSSNHGYTVPFAGDYKMVLSGDIDVSYGTFGDGGNIRIHFLKNGVIQGDVWWGQLPGLGDHGLHAYADDITMTGCQPGDVLSWRIVAETYMWAYKYWVRGVGMEALVYPLASGGIPSVGVNNNQILSCETKQIDLLKGLTEMFNLQWKADAINRTIHIEPYNDFFGTGETKDWSEKLDVSKWNDKFIVEELAKEIVFRYTRDSGDELIEVIDRWRENVGKSEYQTHIEIQSERFRKKSVELGTKEVAISVRTNQYGVQPNPSQHSNGNYGWGDQSWNNPATKKANPIMPIYWYDDGGSINTAARPERIRFPKMKLRILNHYSLLNGHHNEQPDWWMDSSSTKRSTHKCSPYQWETDSGFAQTKDEYPYMDWVDGWKQGVDTDPYCLSWCNHDDQNGKESLGLFEKYWRVAYEKMNGGSVLRTAYFNLTPIDIATFDFRDLIHLRIDSVSTYWTVNKIIDYQPNKNTLTKVELLEFKQAKDFAREYSGNVETRKLDLSGAPGKTKNSLKRSGGFAIENDTNNTALGKGVAIGTGVVANDNQTVLGRFNNPNTTDIFQVGMGTSDDDRHTAFSISQDGCVKIGGGEIYVEEADGTIHDLIIKKDPYQVAEREINENGDNVIKSVEFTDTDIEKLFSSEQTEEEKDNKNKIQGGSKY